MLYDITRPLGPASPVFPGDPPTTVEVVADAGRGDPATVSRLSCSTHAGTHVDAPGHLFPGAPGVDELPLEALIGSALVLHLAAGPISREDLAASILPHSGAGSGRQAKGDRADRILLAGGGFLTESAARFLVERHVRLVGIDSQSIDDPASHALPAHRSLLSAGVVVVENVDLTAVAPGRYDLICLPLRLEKADGAPARVLLSAPESRSAT